MDIYIDQASPEDAERLSALIRRTLLESNLSDYSEEEIGRLCDLYSPDGVRSVISSRQLHMAETNGSAAGCAALEVNKDEPATAWITAVFVDPVYQKKGLGKVMIDLLESSAISQGVRIMKLSSSITAHDFYLKLGFKDIRGSECTLSSDGVFLMQKLLV